jgi:hypothetical protein
MLTLCYSAHGLHFLPAALYMYTHCISAHPVHQQSRFSTPCAPKCHGAAPGCFPGCKFPNSADSSPITQGFLSAVQRSPRLQLLKSNKRASFGGSQRDSPLSSAQHLRSSAGASDVDAFPASTGARKRRLNFSVSGSPGEDERWRKHRLSEIFADDVRCGEDLFDSDSEDCQSVCSSSADRSNGAHRSGKVVRSRSMNAYPAQFSGFANDCAFGVSNGCFGHSGKEPPRKRVYLDPDTTLPVVQGSAPERLQTTSSLPNLHQQTPTGSASLHMPNFARDFPVFLNIQGASNALSKLEISDPVEKLEQQQQHPCSNPFVKHGFSHGRSTPSKH